MLSGSDFIFILNYKNHNKKVVIIKKGHKVGWASLVRLYRGKHGSQQVVKGNDTLFQLILQVFLFQATSEVMLGKLHVQAVL